MNNLDTDLNKYGNVKYNEPLANHCTWRIGGPTDVMIEPSSKEQLSELISYLNNCRQPWLVIGAGSNLLFDVKGIRGVVVKIGRELSKLEISGNKAVCQAGIWVPHLARRLCNAGLSGMEHTAGIPGNLGGLVAMNGGSNRQSIAENIEYVVAINSDGVIKHVTNAECYFGYRTSCFQNCNMTIAEVGIRLQPSNPKMIRREMLRILKERRRKFPLKQPSCGSVFLSNPDNYDKFGPPGAILDKMGLKGFSVGGARISDKHANFIINTGKATTRDVLDLVDIIKTKVKNRYNLHLQCEFRYVSEDGRILKT